jgi:hypothetical protein
MKLKQVFCQLSIKDKQQFISEIKIGILPIFQYKTNANLPKEVFVYLPLKFDKTKRKIIKC